MKNLISALQFITILPLGKAKSFDPPKMVPYFPLVGILLGLMVALFDSIVTRLWAPPVAALLDIALLAVLTAAFHIDGLGDTADGLLGPRSRAIADSRRSVGICRTAGRMEPASPFLAKSYH